MLICRFLSLPDPYPGRPTQIESVRLLSPSTSPPKTSRNVPGPPHPSTGPGRGRPASRIPSPMSFSEKLAAAESESEVAEVVLAAAAAVSSGGSPRAAAAGDTVAGSAAAVPAQPGVASAAAIPGGASGVVEESSAMPPPGPSSDSRRSRQPPGGGKVAPSRVVGSSGGANAAITSLLRRAGSGGAGVSTSDPARAGERPADAAAKVIGGRKAAEVAGGGGGSSGDLHRVAGAVPLPSPSAQVGGGSPWPFSPKKTSSLVARKKTKVTGVSGGAPVMGAADVALMKKGAVAAAVAAMESTFPAPMTPDPKVNKESSGSTMAAPTGTPESKQENAGSTESAGAGAEETSVTGPNPVSTATGTRAAVAVEGVESASTSGGDPGNLGAHEDGVAAAAAAPGVGDIGGRAVCLAEALETVAEDDRVVDVDDQGSDVAEERVQDEDPESVIGDASSASIVDDAGEDGSQGADYFGAGLYENESGSEEGSEPVPGEAALDGIEADGADHVDGASGQGEGGGAATGCGMRLAVCCLGVTVSLAAALVLAAGAAGLTLGTRTPPLIMAATPTKGALGGCAAHVTPPRGETSPLSGGTPRDAYMAVMAPTTALRCPSSLPSERSGGKGSDGGNTLGSDTGHRGSVKSGKVESELPGERPSARKGQDGRGGDREWFKGRGRKNKSSSSKKSSPEEDAGAQNGVVHGSKKARPEAKPEAIEADAPPSLLPKSPDHGDAAATAAAAAATAAAEVAALAAASAEDAAAQARALGAQAAAKATEARARAKEAREHVGQQAVEAGAFGPTSADALLAREKAARDSLAEAESLLDIAKLEVEKIEMKEKRRRVVDTTTKPAVAVVASPPALSTAPESSLLDHAKKETKVAAPTPAAAWSSAAAASSSSLDRATKETKVAEPKAFVKKISDVEEIVVLNKAHVRAASVSSPGATTPDAAIRPAARDPLPNRAAAISAATSVGQAAPRLAFSDPLLHDESTAVRATAGNRGEGEVGGAQPVSPLPRPWGVSTTDNSDDVVVCPLRNERTTPPSASRWTAGGTRPPAGEDVGGVPPPVSPLPLPWPASTSEGGDAAVCPVGGNGPTSWTYSPRLKKRLQATSQSEKIFVGWRWAPNPAYRPPASSQGEGVTSGEDKEKEKEKEEEEEEAAAATADEERVAAGGVDALKGGEVAESKAEDKDVYEEATGGGVDPKLKVRGVT